MIPFSTPAGCSSKGSLPLWMLVCLLLLCGPAWPETAETDAGATLSASLEKNSASVGDLLWVTLTYDIPGDAKLPEKDPVGGMDNLTVTERKTEPHQIRFRVLVDQLASFELGPFSLTYIDSQNNERILTTDPLPLTVVSNLGEKPEEAALKPIQDIISTETGWLRYLSGALAVLVLLGLASGFIRWRKKRRAPGMNAAMEDPPHIKAEKEIDELIASGLFEQGNAKAFYFGFSETIRRYMGSIRRFPAAEMTTEEIARVIKTDPGDQALLPLLRQADLVKFADAIPSPDRKDRDIHTARTYIRQTRPLSDAPPADPSLQEVRP